MIAADMPKVGCVSGFLLTYTISWVCEMPRMGDCLYCDFAVPLQREIIHNFKPTKTWQKTRN